MTTIDVTPTGQACGAFVTGVDLCAPLDDQTVAAIRSAWLDHKVLVFPNQPMTNDDLARYTLNFGPFGEDTFFDSIDEHPNIAAIHRTADETASLFAGTWHADWTFQEFPPDGTCLHARVIPPSGGDTLFANQEAALAAMPAELRGRIENRLAVHSAKLAYSPDGTYGEQDGEDRSMRIRPHESANETQTHSLIRTHPETGAETLYSTLGYIIDLVDTAEPLELLVELSEWQTRDEFVYRHQWESDMLVMWDNRCVLHKATGGYEGHERLLHRTTIGFNAAVRT